MELWKASNAAGLFGFGVIIDINLTKDGGVTVFNSHFSERRASLLAGTAPGGKEINNDKIVASVSDLSIEFGLGGECFDRFRF